MSSNKCESCGMLWCEHDGAIRLCRRLQIVRTLLDKHARNKLSPRETIKAIQEVMK